MLRVGCLILDCKNGRERKHWKRSRVVEKLEFSFGHGEIVVPLRHPSGGDE